MSKAKFVAVLSENQLKIIAILRKYGPLSRKKLATILEVTPASMTQQTALLVSAGIVSEKVSEEQPRHKVGRKEVLLCVNHESRKLLGIDIEVDTVYLAITDLNGITMSSDSFAFDALTTDKEQLTFLVQRCVQIIDELCRSQKISKEAILYCGIGVIGSQFVFQQHPTQTFVVVGNDQELQQQFEAALSLPVTVENNVRALALAESEFRGKTDVTNFIFVKIGPKIGSAIVMENKLLRGESNSAGELGYFRVNEYYPEIDRILKFEDIVSLDFYKAEYLAHFDRQQTPYLFQVCEGDPQNITIDYIHQSLREQDPFTVGVVTKKMNILAVFLYNIKVLLDLQKIYVLMPFDNQQSFLAILQAAAYQIAPEFADSVCASEAQKTKLSVGGAAIASKAMIKDITLL